MHESSMQNASFSASLPRCPTYVCNCFQYDVVSNASVIAETVMSDKEDDELAENILEFDRLMAANDIVDTDELTFSVEGAKPDIGDDNDTGNSDVEMVQLPTPQDRDGSKQLQL